MGEQVQLRALCSFHDGNDFIFLEYCASFAHALFFQALVFNGTHSYFCAGDIFH